MKSFIIKRPCSMCSDKRYLPVGFGSRQVFYMGTVPCPQCSHVIYLDPIKARKQFAAIIHLERNKKNINEDSDVIACINLESDLNLTNTTEGSRNEIPSSALSLKKDEAFHDHT